MNKTLGLANRFLPAPIHGGFKMKDYWVWCGSVIQGEDSRFHMFASRWPKHLPMHPGWLDQSEVVRAIAETPEGPYTFQEVVLPARGAQFWDGRMTHNPAITKYKDTYMLYYTGSTHPFPSVELGEPFPFDDPRCIVGRANKRIGLATSKSIFGPWKRMDQPIIPTRPEKFDSFLTSNPSPCVHEDGSVLLIYKARRYEGREPGGFTLGSARADHYAGLYTPCKEPLFPPRDIHLEDPFVWRTPDGYELIAKDMKGNMVFNKNSENDPHSFLQLYENDPWK